MSGGWSLRFSYSAELDLISLDGSDRPMIQAGLLKLTTDPHLRGHALKGNLAGFRSLVVGKKKIRIVYKVVEQRVVVYVIAIGRRRDGEVSLEAGGRISDPSEL